MSQKTLIEIAELHRKRAQEKERVKQERAAQNELYAVAAYFNNFFKLLEHGMSVFSENFTLVDDPLKGKYYYINYEGYNFRLKKAAQSSESFLVQLEIDPTRDYSWVNIYSLLDFVPILEAYGLIDNVHES